MLSAFKAQPIHELKPRDKSKIESLLAYGDRLFVGLNTGSLRIYRVNESSGATASENGDASQASEKTKAVDLLREEEKFSKKPVQQLAIIKEANLLISLSDAYVSLHDLEAFALVERLEQSKGASCFAVTRNVVQDAEYDLAGLVSRLAVGAKRKLVCWTWQNMERLSETTEVSMEANIKSINWVSGTKLVVGMDPGFSVVDITTRAITVVNRPAPNTPADASQSDSAGIRFGAVSSSGMGYVGMSSWVPKPMATGLAGNLVLLAKDVNTLFTDVEGKATEKRQVPWSFAPEAIGYSYPYLLALQPADKGSLQIRNPDTLSLLQAVSVPGANILHVPQPNISLAHAGKGFLIASDRVIWRMNALPYQAQLTELVGQRRFDEAVSLLNMLEDTLLDDKEGRIRAVKIEKGAFLFKQQNFQAALDLFMDAEAPPQQIAALYPEKIAGKSANADEDSDEEVDDDARKTDTSDAAPVTPSKTVFSLLKGGQKQADSDVASVKSVARNGNDSASVRSKRGAQGEDRPLEGDSLITAVRCLCYFLAQARVQIKRYLATDGTLKENPPQLNSETGKPAFANLLSPTVFDQQSGSIKWENELLSVAKFVDTTLFRSYMLASPGLAGPLFRLDNFCDPEVVQSALYESERYNDLIDFLHGKRLHRQALEMLSKFGRGDASGEIPEGMLGPQRIISYLIQLPPELIDIILEFGRWPIEADAEAGMEIFLADNGNAEHLPRWKVARFLENIDKKLELRYIEHIVNVLDEADPDFHQKLIDLYLAALKENDLDSDLRNSLKERLETFLQASKTYDKSKTFKQLSPDDPTFFEARAIVLSAMKNYKQALSIYVFKMKDYEKAERFCNKVFVERQANATANGGKVQQKSSTHFEHGDGPDSPNLFAILLGLYLQPPSNEQKRWPQALDLLAKHGPRLPTSSTLNLMPDDLAIRELQSYFRGRIRNATSLLREEQVVRSLEGVRRANTERTLMLGPGSGESERPMARNRRFRIGEDDHCKVCHKRFGASAVRVYPNNEIVHYGCVSGGGRAGEKPRSRDGGFAQMRQSSAWG